MNKDEIIKNSIFYRWSTIEASIRTEKPKEYEMLDFFIEIRKDPPEVSKPFAYVIMYNQQFHSVLNNLYQDLFQNIFVIRKVTEEVV